MTCSRVRSPNSRAAGMWREVLLDEVLPWVDATGGRRLRGAEGFIYFNARYYDPTIGRFITEDPSRKGTGWYTYCENNPINKTDPTGLSPWDWIKRNALTIGGVALSGLEVAGGAALLSTGIGSPLGVAMVVHGAVNAAAGISKIVATSIVETQKGSAAATALSKNLPESALGLVAYGVTGGSKAAANIGDLADAAASLAMGAGVGKATEEVLAVAKTARSYGFIAEAEQKAVAAAAKTSTAALVVKSLGETASTVANVASGANAASNLVKEAVPY